MYVCMYVLMYTYRAQIQLYAVRQFVYSCFKHMRGKTPVVNRRSRRCGLIAIESLNAVFGSRLIYLEHILFAW